MKNIFSSLLLILFLHSAAQTVSFIQAPGSPITNFPQQLGHLAVDLNADGFKDLITGRDGPSLSVYLGAGNGQFSPAPGSPITILSSPISVAAADFNSDNILDLATANYNSGGVSILLGTGTGAFNNASGSPITTGSLPYCVDVADFNLDGNKDVIVVNAASNNVRLLLGNGAGSFSTAAGFPITTGAFPYHVSAGFFNTDNFPDFAVVNGNGNTLVVYLGAANGVFTQAAGSPYPTGTQPRTIAVKDLNNDTYPDFVISNALSNNINVFLGSANGSYANAAGSPITLYTYPFQSVIEDFNLDGQQDIATVNGQSNNISILYGNGTGTFLQAPGSPISVGSYPHSLCAADFDNDNRIDLATGDWSWDKMNVLVNKTPVSCSLSATFTYTAGNMGQVSFSSTSSGTTAATSYSWNFGDGNSGTGPAPVHNYTNPGTYTVYLNANNNATPSCQSSASMVITVNICSLIPSFNYTVNASGTVNFVSTSSGTVPTTTFLWNFGNGFLSNLNPVNHSYSSSGVYTVSLSVNNNTTPACQGIVTTTIFISICSLQPSFVYTVGASGVVNFSSTTTGTNTGSTYFWAFGDGGSAATNTVSHAYLNTGTYIATLTVNNNQSPACTGTYTHSIIIDKITGIFSMPQEDQLSITPNPSNGLIKIKTGTLSGKTELMLFNAEGKAEGVFELSSENATVNLQHLKNGDYFYRLVNMGHTIKSGQIILNK